MYFEVALSSEATIEFSRKAMLAGEYPQPRSGLKPHKQPTKMSQVVLRRLTKYQSIIGEQ